MIINKSADWDRAEAIAYEAEALDEDVNRIMDAMYFTKNTREYLNLSRERSQAEFKIRRLDADLAKMIYI